MSWSYKGITTNLVSVEDLVKLVGFSSGINVHVGDISWLTFVNELGEMYLVADRVIRHSINWNHLNLHGVIEGKNISINGKEYVCRVMTGATGELTNLHGGEWDELFVNLPESELDLNWNSCYTICKESSSSTEYAVIRGRESKDYFGSFRKSLSNNINGWRPVLIPSNHIPVFSIIDSNLGDIVSFNSINYIVTESDNDNFALIEKLNNNIIRTLENQTSGTQYALDLTDRWDSISYGKHTIEIIATDTNGLSSTVTITFNKIKAPIETLPTTTGLKQTIAHNKEIDKEIDYQCFRFEEVLKEKGVEVLPSEKKMSTLISKVDNIPLGKKWGEGTTTSSSTVIQFPTYNKTMTATCKYFEISLSSLNFIPTLVSAYSYEHNESYVYFSGYRKFDDGKEISNFSKLRKVGSHNYEAYALSGLIKDNKIYLPISDTNITKIKWIAFE